MKDVFTAQTALQRLQDIKFQISPEERKLLGISEEDVKSFQDLEDPNSLVDALEEIVGEAYKNIPAFKQLVDQDIAQDPNAFRKSGKIVAAFLHHLEDELDPKVSAGLGQPFDAAQKVLSKIVKTTRPVEAPAAPAEAPQPLDESELNMFGLKRSQLKPELIERQLEKPVMFFLGKLRNEEGKKVKNEATAKMPDDMKIDMVYRLYRELRDIKKAAQGGKLKPHEIKWLGDNDKQTQLIARSLVTRPTPAQPGPKGTGISDVMSQTSEAAILANRVMEILNSDEMLSELNKIESLLETTMPSAAEVESKFNKIQEEANKLGLSKKLLNMLLETDTTSLSHIPETGKEKAQEIEEAEKNLAQKVQREGETEDTQKIRKNLENRKKDLETLSAVDTTALFAAIDDYLNLLQEAREKAKANLSKASESSLPDVKRLIEFLGDLTKKFGRLSREDKFRLKWHRAGGRLFREDEPTETEEDTTSKVAADIGGYADKIQEFRGGGLGDTLDKIREFGDDEGTLAQIRDKIFSVLEAKPGTKLNPTEKDFTGNPLAGHEEPTLDDAVKALNSMRANIKKFNFKGKLDEAMNIFSWASNLQNLIKTSTSKKASLINFVRGIFLKMAAKDPHRTMGLTKEEWNALPKEERLEKMKSIQEREKKWKSDQEKKPGKGESRGLPPAPASEAGWIIYRERLTKMGKKTLQDFFDEPTFVEDFVEQMEKEGLGKMLLEGGSEKPVNVDDIVAKIMQKATKVKGKPTFENILGTKVMQEAKSEFDIKRAEKDLKSSDERLREKNEGIIKLEKKVLPKLQEFARFLKDPLTALREKAILRKDMPEKEEPEKELSEEKKPKPPSEFKPSERIDVQPHNVQQLLMERARQYGVLKKTAAEYAVTPSEEYKKMLVHRKRLQDAQPSIEAIKDPYRRAQKLKDLYEMHIQAYENRKKYIESDVVGKLEADQKVVDEAEKLLSSGRLGEMKEQAQAQVRNLIDSLKPVIKKNKDQLETIKKEIVKDEGPIKDYKRRLEAIKEDLKDGEVDRLYEIAISPEMMPSEKEEKEISRERREREKAIGTLMDKNTYKKWINRMTDTFLKRKPGEPQMDPGKTFVMPSERAQEAQDKVNKAREEEARLNRTIKHWEKKRKMNSFYQRMIAMFENAVKEYDQAVKQLEETRGEIEKAEQYFSENKDTMGPEGVRKHEALISSLKEKVKNEKDTIKRSEDIKKGIEEVVDEYREKSKRLSEELTPKPSEPTTVEEIKKKLQNLTVERMAIPTRHGMNAEQEAKRIQELAKEIAELKQKLTEARARGAVPEKTAGKGSADPYGPSESAFDIALKEKGTTPDFVKDLPKPKGWDVVENFFDNARSELKILENVKAKGTDWDEVPKEVRQSMIDRMDYLERVIPAIDAYQKQIVQIAGKEIPFSKTMQEFEDMLMNYQNEMRKLLNQRDDAAERSKKLRQTIRGARSFYDPDTGEFKGFTPEEVNNLKDMFFRILYKEMDGYWATKVGKDISVFGERDTEWYNNVFRTFKNLSGVRSNRKLMALLNKYKAETRTDFPTDASVRLDKIEELTQRRDEFLKRYKDLGLDPSRSEGIKHLNTRIETLEKQKNQINKVFDEMAGAVQAEIAEKATDAVASRISGEKPKTKVDYDKKADEEIKDVEGILEQDMKALQDIEKDLGMVDTLMGKAEQAVSKREKEAAYRKSAHFDPKILYSERIQARITEMLTELFNR